jgi:hypothetical protein
MRKLFIALAGLFSGLIFSAIILGKISCSPSVHADYQASFNGVSLSGLAHTTTAVEYNGAVDASGNLLDLTVNARHFSPTNMLTGANSIFQNPDGNLWMARQIRTTGYYQLVHAAWMNMFTTPFTMTFLMSQSSTGAGTDVIFGHQTGNNGMSVTVNGTIVAVLMYNGSTSVTASATLTRDNLYHTVQIVRDATSIKVAVDSVFGAATACTSAYGTDVSTTLLLPSYGDFDLQYFRIDAEAFSDGVLFHESQRLLGFGAYAGGISFPSHVFTRATSATVEFNNRSLATVASGVPRVTNGFLSEQLISNQILQSQVMGTTWTPTALTSITANVATPLAPDGTATADGLIATAVDTTHYISQDITTTAASWTCSLYAQPGNMNWIYFANAAVANADAYFNVSNCTTGTVGASATATAIPSNGWCKASITFTGTASGGRSIQIYPALADTDADFAGDATTINTYFWQVDCTPSAVALAPIPTTTVAVTKNADVMTIDPFKYEDMVRQGSETMVFNFDQDPTAASIDSNASNDYGMGTYTWTGLGTRARETTERYGSYWKFDGSSTRCSRAESVEFLPDASGSGANFSIVAAVVPNVPASTYGYIFAKYNTTADREYAIYINQTGGCTFAVSHDGTNPTYASKLLTCYTVGRPLFLAMTYQFSGVADAPGALTGTSTGKLYVNDQSVVTDTAFLGPIYDGVADTFIGRSTAGSYFQGKILWVNWYKGTVLDAATIANMYDQWKQKWLIAPQMGDVGEEMKLYVNFDYKLRAASASAAGDSLVEIGNNYGKSDINSNRISCAALTTTLVCSYWNDTTTATQRTITISGLTQNTWHSVNYYVDLTNLANSTMTVDGTAGSAASMTGSSSLNLRDASIHIGHDYTGAAGFANGWVKNVKVLSTP